jgi:hypothetical protein
MTVIGSLYVSLGSSIVQLNNAHAYIQRLGLIIKMATVLKYTIEEQLFFFFGEFFVDKRTQCKSYHEEIYPNCGGKCPSRKSNQN